MPTYSYACTECGDRFDVVQAFTDDALTTCEKCSGRLRKLFNSVGVVFKGSGFYRTDSRESGKKVEDFDQRVLDERLGVEFGVEQRSLRARATRSNSSSTPVHRGRLELASYPQGQFLTGIAGAALRLPLRRGGIIAESERSCAGYRRRCAPTGPGPCWPGESPPAGSSCWPAWRHCGRIQTMIVPRWWWPRATCAPAPR